jgi:hypothetical protein
MIMSGICIWSRCSHSISRFLPALRFVAPLRIAPLLPRRLARSVNPTGIANIYKSMSQRSPQRVKNDTECDFLKYIPETQCLFFWKSVGKTLQECRDFHLFLCQFITESCSFPQIFSSLSLPDVWSVFCWECRKILFLAFSSYIWAPSSPSGAVFRVWYWWCESERLRAKSDHTALVHCPRTRVEAKLVFALLGAQKIWILTTILSHK